MLSRIPSVQLRPGMYLHKLCGSWMQHPFWRTSFLIRDREQIALIIDSGIVEVWIDLEKGDGADAAVADAPVAADAVDAADHGAAGDTDDDPGDTDGDLLAPPATATAAQARPAQAGALRAPASTAPTRFADEMVTARRLCASARPQVTAMFREARLGKALETEAALEIVDEIAASVMRNPSALVSVARLKSADDYTYLHSIAVCALMVALARQLKLADDDVRRAGLGGLLHDIGKSRIPLELLNKPSSLSEQEFVVIRTHPEHGYAMLRETGSDDEAVLDVVLHHHERYDGTGYPHGLAGEHITLLARMGAVCDVYDAVTSERPYKAGWDPAQALHRMNAWQGHFDPVVLQHFVRSIGIYPVGALVRLESDKLAVVCEQGSGSLLKPRVKAFFSARTRKQVPVHEIDLAAPGCQDRITGVEAPATWGFKQLERLWMP